MNIHILHQIHELANSANQEILMREVADRQDIKEFSKTENNYSFEFKTTNSLESPHRYVFKRRLRCFNPQIPKILITADFLDKELELYEARKTNLHHHLVFMYNDRMIKFNMRDIRLWMMNEGPNPKEVQIRNKKCQDGSFAPCTEMVYHIPSSVPSEWINYRSSEATRASIYNMWTNPFDPSDDEPVKTPTLSPSSISPYF